MNIESIIVGIGTGLVSSAIVALLFYRLGRTDTESAYRRFILTLVDMRLRQMIPTRRQSVPEHYDLRDTAHWLTCLLEVLTELRFSDDAAAVKDVLDGVSRAPAFDNPNEQQAADGETNKKRWEGIIHDRTRRLR